MTDSASQLALHHSGKADRGTVARRAMIGRSFQAEFLAAALAELAQLTQSAAHAAPPEAPLHGLLRASIDNDDSRDPDQLSVVEPLPDGTVKGRLSGPDPQASA